MGTVKEKSKSRGRTWGQGDEIRRRYTILGAATEEDAKTLLLGAGGAPASLDGRIRKSYGVDELANGTWEGFASWGKSGELLVNDPPATNDVRRSWTTRGGSQRVTHALAMIGSYVPPGATTTPDFSGAINVNDDRIEGVEIPAPQVRLRITAYLPVATVTDAYMNAVENMTATTNNAPFKGRPTGSLLFLGVEGSQRNADDWELDFEFAYSKNVTGKAIGPITGIDKKGWEYLWVLYEHAVDSTAKKIVRSPRAVYVQRVFEESDFSTLLIP